MATSDDTALYIGTADITEPQDIDDLNKGAAEIRQVKIQQNNTWSAFTGAAVTATEAEINYLDITTLGTAQASKAVTIAANSTYTLAGMTCSDLGTVTTAAINGGTIGSSVTATTQTQGDNSTKLATTAYVDGVLPSGAVLPFAIATAPTGWLECDGSAVSRTTYADLFTAIGVTYGSGDGSTTFNVPDIRGRFVRGWDHGAGVDPDAASRTDRGDTTTGDNVGTKQADQLESHTHTDTGRINNGIGTIPCVSDGGDSYQFTSDATGGNETRPVNIYLMYCIKT